MGFPRGESLCKIEHYSFGFCEGEYRANIFELVAKARRRDRDERTSRYSHENGS
jgi:hypothetical protein